MKNKPIILVPGEPYSIFLEIFFKALKQEKYKNPIIFIGSKDLLIKQMSYFKFRYKINLIDKEKIDSYNLDNKKINIINVNFKFKKIFGKITINSNNYISNCFSIALKILKKNSCAGLVNGPISKKHFLKEQFLGITEYLASKTNKKNKVTMLIFNKKLSVSPTTTHLPLKLVHKNISKKKIIDQVKLINNFFKKTLNKTPKIGVTGLNPHCESNYKSSEEEKFIKPAIKYLIRKKFNIEGPFAADTIFMSEQSKKYNVIVGMYHDQVLTPSKTLFGFHAVNITLGLPFIRISPDHGPNDKMLGKNMSNPKSLILALKFFELK